MVHPLRPLILVTNDDGVKSPGLEAAAGAVAGLGELLIVAPATQQTGMGRATPPIVGGAIDELQIRCAGRVWPAFAVTGSPAQAVIYGAQVLAQRKPALVISGVNYGENPGTCVTASGTVGAALQAAELGIPALAVSLETDKAYHFDHSLDVDWRPACRVIEYFAGELLQGQLPPDVDVLKIDIPSCASPETSWRVTRQSRQSYYRTFRAEHRLPGPGELVKMDYDVWINWETLEPDSDIFAFAHDRVISVTPLSIDMTSRTDLGVLDTWLRQGRVNKQG